METSIPFVSLLPRGSAPDVQRKPSIRLAVTLTVMQRNFKQEDAEEFRPEVDGKSAGKPGLEQQYGEKPQQPVEPATF